jgi:hypothetical protein
LPRHILFTRKVSISWPNKCLLSKTLILGVWNLHGGRYCDRECSDGSYLLTNRHVAELGQKLEVYVEIFRTPHSTCLPNVQHTPILQIGFHSCVSLTDAFSFQQSSWQNRSVLPSVCMHVNPKSLKWSASNFAPFWDFTQRRTVVSYWRFGTTHRSHLQGSSSQRLPSQVAKNP